MCLGHFHHVVQNVVQHCLHLVRVFQVDSVRSGIDRVLLLQDRAEHGAHWGRFGGDEGLDTLLLRRSEDVYVVQLARILVADVADPTAHRKLECGAVSSNVKRGFSWGKNARKARMLFRIRSTSSKYIVMLDETIHTAN